MKFLCVFSPRQSVFALAIKLKKNKPCGFIFCRVLVGMVTRPKKFGASREQGADFSCVKTILVLPGEFDVCRGGASQFQCIYV